MAAYGPIRYQHMISIQHLFAVFSEIALFYVVSSTLAFPIISHVDMRLPV